MTFLNISRLVCLMSALLLPGLAFGGEEAPKTTLVLDASGSMWGQIDGIAKISIAQSVISGLVRDLPEDMELGLTVYGHRRKGDCGDIESLIPPSANNRTNIIAGIKNIKPKGKTPLSAAVLQAAQELRHTEERATVILVSDGEETCSLDPCAVGRELEETGIDFTVHVVGFDIADAETQAQLQCLATETGGTYLDANSASSLTQALTKVTTTKPSQKTEVQQAVIDGPEKAPAGGEFSVAWEGPANEGDFIGIVPSGDAGGTLLGSADLRDGNPLILQATPEVGLHDLVYVDYETGSILARTPIEIIKVGATLIFEGPARAGGLLDVAWTGPGNTGDYVAIAQKGAALPDTTYYFDVAEGPQGVLQMPSEPGPYEIRYITNTDPRVILTNAPLELEDAPLTLKAPSTAVAGSTISVLWNGTSNPSDYIAFAHPGEALPHILTMAVTGDGNPLSVPVPDQPGIYELRFYFAAGDRIVRSLPITVE